MTVSLSRFTHALKYAPHPNKFEVEVSMPPILREERSISLKNQYQKWLKRNINLTCTNVSIPGKTLFTEANRRQDLLSKVVYNVDYQAFNMTLLVSEGMAERLFFEAWLKHIIPNDGSGVSYYNDYVTTIKIKVFSTNNPSNHDFIVSFYEAYPISMSEHDLGYDIQNAHMKLQIGMTYKSYEIT